MLRKRQKYEKPAPPEQWYLDVYLDNFPGEERVIGDVVVNVAVREWAWAAWSSESRRRRFGRNGHDTVEAAIQAGLDAIASERGYDMEEGEDSEGGASTEDD